MAVPMDPAASVVRKRHRREINNIFVPLLDLGPELSWNDLKTLGVQYEEINLFTKQPFLFFSKYPGTIKVPELDNVKGVYPPMSQMSQTEEAPFLNTIELAWHMNRFFNHCIVPDKNNVPPGTQYACYGDFNFGSLSSSSMDYRWQVRSAWNMRERGLPHMVVLMYTGVTTGDQLLRSELTAIIDIMHGRLRTTSTRPHTVAPVLMFSVVGLHHIRVIEAFYDGAAKKLVVRVSKRQSIDKPYDDFYLYLTHYWLGHASSRSTTDV
ncbi:hypothetical protein BJX64DRAFT_260059 [Aspergillus heterothallicus]